MLTAASWPCCGLGDSCKEVECVCRDVGGGDPMQPWTGHRNEASSLSCHVTRTLPTRDAFVDNQPRLTRLYVLAASIDAFVTILPRTPSPCPSFRHQQFRWRC